MEHQLLMVVLLLVGQARANPWHFGEDHPSYRVIYQISGHIWPLCYNTRQIITVPPCMSLKYVYVAVYNSWSIPTVNFHSTLNVVSIVYGLLQCTKSGYDIVAKGYRTPNCNPGVIENSNNYIPFRLNGPKTDDPAHRDTRTDLNGFNDTIDQNLNLTGGIENRPYGGSDFYDLWDW